MSFSVPIGSAASGRSSGEDACELLALVHSVEQLLNELLRCRERATAEGVPLAATYIEGAQDSLAHALQAICKAGARPRTEGVVLPLGTGRVMLRSRSERNDVAVAEGIGVSKPVSAGKFIGASLAQDAAEIDLLRKDNVASGLMIAALAHHDWLHMRTDDVFYGDALAAHGIVATLIDRTHLPRWTRAQMRGLIDERSLAVLNRLGWRRVSGPALPGH